MDSTWESCGQFRQAQKHASMHVSCLMGAETCLLGQRPDCQIAPTSGRQGHNLFPGQAMYEMPSNEALATKPQESERQANVSDGSVRCVTRKAEFRTSRVVWSSNINYRQVPI